MRLEGSDLSEASLTPLPRPAFAWSDSVALLNAKAWWVDRAITGHAAWLTFRSDD